MMSRTGIIRHRLKYMRTLYSLRSLEEMTVERGMVESLDGLHAQREMRRQGGQGVPQKDHHH